MTAFAKVAFTGLGDDLLNFPTILIASANGFAGSLAIKTITLSTSITGMLKGNGTAISAGVSGTDYAPGTASLATGILKSTTTTGGLSIAGAGDFPTLNQNTSGNAATVTTNANLTGDVTSIGNATTLATVNATTGTFGSTSVVPVITVNAKGLVTSITTATITPAAIGAPSGSGTSTGTNTGDQTLSDATITTMDITTNNVSTTKHGFAPRLPNDSTKYLDGTGAYSVPPSGAAAAGTLTGTTLNSTVVTSSLTSFLVATTFSVAGAASVSPLLFSGVLLTGGSATTNFPHLFLQPAGTTAVTTWSTSGTFIGVNAATGFAGKFLDFRIAGGASQSLFEVNSAGLITGTGLLLNDANAQINMGLKTKIFSSVDGKLIIWNQAQNNFTALCFGGTTSSFPSLKRTTTVLGFRLADDSADSGMTASTGAFSGNLTVAGQATCTPQVLTSSSASIAWNANLGNNARHVATENTTLANPTNLADGTVYTFRWKQHASAAKTLAFGSKWKFVGSSTVSATVNAVCTITGMYNATDDIIECTMTVGPYA